MPTSLARISNKNLIVNNRAFTLIELMLVLGIIAFVIGIGIPRLGKTLGTQLKAITRHIVVLNRELHNSARLKNKTYRLCFDFGDPGKKREPQIVVESGSGALLVDNPNAEKDFYADDKKKKEPPPFSVDTEVLKKPITLPYGVKFEDVELETAAKPITEGRACVHFFPQGLVQKAIVHLTDGGKIHWSLIVNPLTAQTDIRDTYIKLQDIQQ